MKKRFFISIVGYFMACAAANAASSTADLSSSPARAEKVEIEVREADVTGRWIKSDANLYYVAKDKRNGQVYREFGGCVDEGCEKKTRSVRAEVQKVSVERKYNMANPFFQPLAFGVSGTTDLAFTSNKIDFSILPGSGAWANHAGTYKAEVLSATQTLSFGITDEIAILGMARYANTDLNVKWDTIADAEFNNDTMSEGKMDTWGLGAQWRFIDDDDFIGYIQGSYQSMVDVATVYVLEAKLGYKNDDTTIYGLGRVYQFEWENDGGYGFGLTNQHGQTEYFSQKEESGSSLYYEVGGGLFAALNADWSADVRAVYSDMEWHSQIYARAEIAYQPWKNFAIAFYGKMSLWDSAEDFKDSSVFGPDAFGVFTRQGTADFENYSDLSAGVMVRFGF